MLEGDVQTNVFLLEDSGTYLSMPRPMLPDLSQRKVAEVRKTAFKWSFECENGLNVVFKKERVVRRKNQYVMQSATILGEETGHLPTESSNASPCTN